MREGHPNRLAACVVAIVCWVAASASGGNWLVIQEVQYASGEEDDAGEFLEIYSSDPPYVDLSGYSLVGDVHFLFPRGSRIDAGERHAFRFRVDADRRTPFVDRVHGPQDGTAPGDFVVWRSDGVPAYHLAVVVDDAAMRITEVVRGDDLLSSTPHQRLLYGALGHRAPDFAHVPLLVDRTGVRLSKRQRGITLRELRERGFTPSGLVGRLAGLLGLWGAQRT